MSQHTSPLTVDQHTAVLNAIPAHVALLENNGVILAVNDAWRRFATANVLQSADFYVGQNYLGVCEGAHGECADEAQAVATGIRKVLSGEAKEFGIEYPCHSPDEKRWYRLMVTPFSETPGIGAVVMHVDITQRILAEDVLRQNEREQRQLAEKLASETRRLHESQAVGNVGSWETDLATLSVTWTDETYSIFETNPDEFEATHLGFLERVHPEDRERVDAAFLCSAGEPGPFAIEHRLMMPDGRIKIVEERWQTFTDATGKPVRAIGTCQDITERKAAEAALRASDSKFRQLAESHLLGLLFWNAQGNISDANDTFLQMVGYTREELASGQIDWRTLTPPEYQAADEQALAEIGVTGRCTPFEKEYFRKDGRRVAILIGAAALEGAKDRGISYVVDISQHKQALAERNHIFNLSLDMLSVANFDGRLEQVNRAWTECLGWTAEELTSRPMNEFILPEDRDATNATRARIRQGEKIRGFENRYRCKDGSYRWLSWSAHALLESRKVFAVVRDVTERKRTEEAIAQSEARFRGLFDQAAVGMCLVSTEGDFLRTNARFCEIVGYSPAELLQRDFIAITHPEEREMEAKIVARMLAGELQSKAWEKRYVHKAGHSVWCNLTLSLPPGGSGQPPQFVAVIKDVSERRAAVEQLRQREQLLRIAGKFARLGGWSVDFPEVRITWSDEVCAIHDMPLGTVPALDQALDFYTAESRPVIESAFSLCASEGTPFDVEMELLTAKGRRAWVRSIGQAERDAAGTITRVQGAFQDISEKKAAEQEITRTNRALKMLSACGEALIHAVDESDLLKVICEIAVASGGYRMAWVGFAQEDAQRTIKPMAHAGEEAGYLSEVALSWDENTREGSGPAGRTIRTGQPNMSEDMEQDASFHWRDVARQRGYRSVICLPLRRGERTFGLLGLYSADVLKAGAEELKLLQELADDLAFGIGHLRAQRESERIHSAVTRVATAVSASTGTEFFEQLAESMAGALGAAAGFVAEMLPGDPPGARTVAAMVDGKNIENFDYSIPETPCVQLLADDEYVVAERVRELFPKASNLASLGAEAYVGRRLTNAAGEKIGLIFVLFREPLKETAFITSTLRIFAARATSELERQKSDKQLREQAALLDAAHDAILVKDLEDHVLYWNRGAERLYGWAPHEVIGRKASTFLWSASTEVEDALKKVQEDGTWEGELRNLGKKGEAILVQASWTLVRDSDGRPTSVLSINSDVTEKKKLEAQFLRAQRMESIGTLAGGIAHDLNNVLTPILMSVEMLKATSKNEEDLDLLATLLISAQRGANLVSQVLSFARGVEGKRVPVHVGHLIRDLVRVMRDTFPKNITVEFTSSATLWSVIGDATQIHQVILNICVNARDAMPYGGTLTIGAKNIVLDETYRSMNPSAETGSYVVIKVEDSGTGILPEVQERIFEPFFTTKETGQGTGLGLSTTAAIVKSHNGFINLYSEVGKGTTFKVYFPADASKEASEEQSIEQTRLPRGRGELILVVDDEESIRKVAKKTLERFGYRVMVAAHGAEAIAIYAQNQSAIAVILTDMAMPIMDGPTMIIALKSMNPKVRIIGSSGLNSNGGGAKAVGAGVEHFISKPYTAEAMLRSIRDILDSH